MKIEFRAIAILISLLLTCQSVLAATANGSSALALASLVAVHSPVLSMGDTLLMGRSRRILPSCRSCCAKRESMQHRLCVGFVKKGDQGRKTGAAFRAVPNVTRVVVAPILRPYGRNQLSIALNATQHVTLPTNTRR